MSDRILEDLIGDIVHIFNSPLKISEMFHIDLYRLHNKNVIKMLIILDHLVKDSCK